MAREFLDLAKVNVAGSAEEVREVGLDPRKVYTCGPARPGMPQCPLYDQCEQPEKDQVGFVTWATDGKPVKWDANLRQFKLDDGTKVEGADRIGPGPLNLGVRRSKRKPNGDFKVINSTCKCWEYPHQKHQWLSVNEGGKESTAIINVIAVEGQSINLPGSLPVTQEDLKVVHVIQKQGIPTVIQPFVRPRDNPNFAASTFAVSELNREEERRKKSDLKDFVKLSPAQMNREEPFELSEGKPNPGPAKGGASSRG